MSKILRKVTSICLLSLIILQASPNMYAAETSTSMYTVGAKTIENTAVCDVKTDEDRRAEAETKVNIEDEITPPVLVFSTQAQKINDVLNEAKETLKAEETITIENLDVEELKKYSIKGQLVPYIRSVVITPIDDKTVQAKIEYTTWYQAIKAYKEPELYANQISDVAKQTLEKAKEVIKELKLEDEKSAYVKEKAIHDYLIANGKYSQQIVWDMADAMHGAEGLILNQDGICRSYAESMQLYMEMLGVESKLVMGVSKLDYQKHVWNMVKLDDGKWYYVDLTFDETIPEIAGRVNYDYFNIPYELIVKDHEFEEWQLLIESGGYDYFTYKDAMAKNEDQVVEIIKQNLENSNLKGEIYISYKTDIDQVMYLVKEAMSRTEVRGKINVTKESRKVYSFTIMKM